MNEEEELEIIQRLIAAHIHYGMSAATAIRIIRSVLNPEPSREPQDMREADRG